MSLSKEIKTSVIQKTKSCVFRSLPGATVKTFSGFYESKNFLVFIRNNANITERVPHIDEETG